ncbi:Zn-finger nucleic acid-binding protein [Paenibacillus sp. DS2015]|uniref:TFIIB-type zinc ribbon-containing protein n=1 Tax=Paenibacillus sp. DS2015 TaxID=3373917 RepID=UPI003D217382
MKCPVCNDIRMREVEKNDVMIDVCPECKGVWLDRNELEKLMSEVREQRPAYNEWNDKRYEEGKYDSKYPQNSNSNGHYKKKKSVLDVFSDLF